MTPDVTQPAILAPSECTSMDQVRAGVDATDRELLRLLAQRFGYMRAAARIKSLREQVRDEERKRAVIAAACRDADRLDVPAMLVASLWEQLVEASIAYELAEWDRIRM